MSLLVGLAMLLAGFQPAAAQSPVVTTDKADYAPGETVTITGSNFLVGSYDIPVIRPDGTIVKGDGSFVPGFDTVTAGADGSFVYPYILNGIDGLYEVRVYDSPWSGELSETPVAMVTFTDSGGAYTLNFAAADPSIYIPPIPFPNALTAPTGRGNGNPLIPLAQFNDGTSDVRVESLAPEDMALGQIVPFELEITVSGDTTPENGVITFVLGWNTLTTNSNDFGYDARGDDVGHGVIGAFIDTGDGTFVDANNDATVDSFTWSLIDDEIVGIFTVSGLDDGDTVVLEPWLVLDDTISAGVGGNVQSRLIDAAT